MLHAHDLAPKHWANPLEARLPNAPSLRIYATYGVGIATERGYFYTPTRGEEESGRALGEISAKEVRASWLTLRARSLCFSPGDG